MSFHLFESSDEWDWEETQADHAGDIDDATEPECSASTNVGSTVRYVQVYAMYMYARQPRLIYYTYIGLVILLKVLIISRMSLRQRGAQCVAS